jgi:predicted nucleotidyltransferase
MAERTTILRVPAGSNLHGLALPGKDDRDEVGVCVEDLNAAVGSVSEQYIYRTAAEREGKHDAPSQHGDLDLTIFSLRKFLRLAMQGNPQILQCLFVPQELCLYRDARGAGLQELAPLIVSRHAGNRYLGYLEAQRQRLPWRARPKDQPS